MKKFNFLTSLIKLFAVFLFFLTLVLIYPQNLYAQKTNGGGYYQSDTNANNPAGYYESNTSTNDDRGYYKSTAGNNTSTTTDTGTTDIRSQITKIGIFKSNIGDYVSLGIEAIFIIGAILCLVYLIWGGIDWILSGGEEKNYASARGKMTTAVIGLAALACSWIIWTLVLYFFGLNNLEHLNIGGLSKKATSASGTSTTKSSGTQTSSQSCWPFNSCAEWQAQYKTEHGYTPTLTGSEYKDLQWSADYLKQNGKAPSNEDWMTNYCKQNPDKCK
ncbi:hypothetical protein GYA19_04560 [Candidatus Beckwithbacteria bacterium]|nr:hypothetical protein [Candidatus Beckwithbacteria bacterium]